MLNPARRDKGSEDLINDRITWVWAWLAADPDAEPYGELMRARTEAAAASGEAQARALQAHPRRRVLVRYPRAAKRPTGAGGQIHAQTEPFGLLGGVGQHGHPAR